MTQRRRDLGTVYPNGRGKFVAQLPPSMGRRSKTFATEDEAWAWLRAENARRVLGTVDQVGARDTVEAVAWLWLATQPLKATTIGNYTRVIKSHIAGTTFGAMPIGDVLPMHIDAVLMDGPRNWNVTRVDAVLSGLFKWAEANRLTVGNPYRQSRHAAITKAVRKAMVPRVQTETVWTLDQVGAFIRAEHDPVLRRLWIVIAATGARRGEALGMRWETTYPGEGWAWLWDNIVQAAYSGPQNAGTPKGGQRRRAYFGPYVASVLEEQRADQETYRAACRAWSGDWVFDRRNRGRHMPPGVHLSPQTVTVRFNALADELTLPPLGGPHGLRRTLATVLRQEGYDHGIRQAVLGHAPDVTDRYSKVTEDERREVAEHIDKLLRIAVGE